MVTGTEGPDVLANDPNSSSDTINALGGDDLINITNPSGGGGLITVDGGAGVDTLTISTNYLRDLDGSSARLSDSYISPFNYLQFSSVERLVVYAGAFAGISSRGLLFPAHWFTGDTQDEIHVLNSFAGLVVVEVHTGGGDDKIYFGAVAGGSFGFGGSGNDLIDASGSRNGIGAIGDGGDDILIGSLGDDNLQGREGADELRGGEGEDYIDGGSGDDILIGGPGSDSYRVDSEGDTIIENSGEGVDEIRTALAAYSLVGSPNVEFLRPVSDFSAAPHDFRGNSGYNELWGGGGNDLLRLNDGGDDTGFGGGGDDIFYFGASMTAADRAIGDVGRDVVVLQGDYTLTLGIGAVYEVETLVLLSGSDTQFGDMANNSYDYDLTTVDWNVLTGDELMVDGRSLRVGEDFTFDGSVETDGRFIVFGGHGVDTLKGGSGNDVFVFEGDRWGTSDKVDGSGGRDSVVITAGDGLTHVDFGAASLAGIESISVANRYSSTPGARPSYEFRLDNGNVGLGGTLIVNASSLRPGQVMKLDGSGVHDGNLVLFGGAGHDTLTAGGGADVLFGGPGADGLTGGAGMDTFRYDSASDSLASWADLIGDFQSGLDKVDLSRIDADTTIAGDQAFAWIGSSGFSGAAGELRTYEADGYRWVAGDMDGDGGADFAIAFQVGTSPLVREDFLL